MIGLIKNLLLRVIKDIDAGNSHLTEEEALQVIETLKQFSNKEKYLSKYAAAEYLSISRATFDSYVHSGKLPKGVKMIGFKELAWRQKDLQEFLRIHKTN